ncbi:MAG: hypothetical protein BGO01_13725 [Armatimonadetes bacterium 55-13]|nr:DUF2961 domain-containing protein [Armatimonadota bacterium]OJU64786.1 MAG: hypothetical protein BGO01_13725 [Armatimonadetes bacterium 55-13]
MLGSGSLHNLPVLRDFISRRSSSWDQSGGNEDWRTIPAGTSHVLLDEAKPGCIRHIWLTVGNDDSYPRKAVIRMWWDGEENPSVEVPLGDFFGIGHGIRKNFVSAPLQMSPEDGRGFSCWFPMPFNAARIEVQNECENDINLYYYVDFEEYAEPHPAEVARFHAQWRRENPTEGWLKEKLGPENYLQIWASKKTLDDKDNYLILEAEGDGIFVGCNLNIDCFQRQGNDWYGEGDDMFVIDGEPWPPRLHGTGTEDYFCTAFGPAQEYCAPYHGITVNSGTAEWRWKGKNSMYRFHIEDPIRFRKSIRVSIEHGHANKLSNDYSSTAYWYQVEPHKPFPPLLPVEERLPRPNEPQFP